MHDAGLIDALNDATSLQLYQLAALVDRLITDPKRIVAIRRQLHLGQLVRFYDARGDQMRLGRVVRLRDTQLIVHGIEVRYEWKLPYAALEPHEPGRPPETAAPPLTSAAKPTRADCSRGDKVSFTDWHLQVQVGNHYPLQSEDGQRRRRWHSLERALRGTQARPRRLNGRVIAIPIRAGRTSRRAVRTLRLPQLRWPCRLPIPLTLLVALDLTSGAAGDACIVCSRS